MEKISYVEGQSGTLYESPRVDDHFESELETSYVLGNPVSSSNLSSEYRLNVGLFDNN